MGGDGDLTTLGGSNPTDTLIATHLMGISIPPIVGLTPSPTVPTVRQMEAEMASMRAQLD